LRFENIWIVFLSICYFFKDGDANTEVEAVKMMLDNHILPNCSQFNCQVFRNTRYWDEECDNIIKSHYDIIENLYETRSGRRKLPGDKVFMAFDEFLEIFADAGLMSDEFPERDVIACYANSMMTHIDELGMDKHMKMQKIEFCEALARAAEMLSLPPDHAVVFFEFCYICLG